MELCFLGYNKNYTRKNYSRKNYSSFTRQFCAMILFFLKKAKTRAQSWMKIFVNARDL